MAILTHDDGVRAGTPELSQHYQAAGYTPCYGRVSQRGNAPCDFHIAPVAQSYVADKGGYYTCPGCYESHNLMEDLPWHGTEEAAQGYRPGATRIGLGRDEQAQIGENLVQALGQLPGYGPITWWHSGDAYGASPLDGATQDWGIEVKTLGYDATHHRFVPGGGPNRRADEKERKNQQAVQMGKKGVLGLLVLLNYRNGKADIFAREFPVDPVAGTGIGSFRSSNAQHLIAEVPFSNPFADPTHPAPHSSQPAQQADPIPF